MDYELISKRKCTSLRVDKFISESINGKEKGERLLGERLSASAYRRAWAPAWKTKGKQPRKKNDISFWILLSSFPFSFSTSWRASLSFYFWIPLIISRQRISNLWIQKEKGQRSEPAAAFLYLFLSKLSKINASGWKFRAKGQKKIKKGQASAARGRRLAIRWFIFLFT